MGICQVEKRVVLSGIPQYKYSTQSLDQQWKHQTLWKWAHKTTKLKMSPPSQSLQSRWVEGQSSIIHNGLSKDAIIPHLISMLAYAVKYDNFKLRWTLFILFPYKRLGWGSNSWHSCTTMGTLFPHCSLQKAFLKARDRCLSESRPHFLAQYLIYSPLMTCLVEWRKWRGGRSIKTDEAELYHRWYNSLYNINSSFNVKLVRIKASENELCFSFLAIQLKENLRSN